MPFPANTELSLGPARASWSSGELVVSTGEVVRAYRIVAGGLETTLLQSADGTGWIADAGSRRPDWHIYALTPDGANALLVDVSLEVREQSAWTSPHLEVVFVFRYEATQTELRYRIWVYPGAPGIRTQVGLRWIGERDRKQVPSYLGGSWGESLRLDIGRTERLAAGYYNDTQHRNRDDTPLLREASSAGPVAQREVHDWANLLRFTRGDAGLTVVKESHKCVNQQGVDTGEFVVDPDGVRVTGLGIDDLLAPSDFVDGWATWLILHSGAPDDAALALKRFDRIRYPVVPERDLLVFANTWGTRGAGWRSRSAATQDNILGELRAAAALGVEGVQIDDGWQCEPGDPERPFDVDWLPNLERFPDGWATVRQEAERLGVKLGLWAPARVDAEALVQNLRQGAFRYLKLDFMHLGHRRSIDEHMAKARQVIEASGGELRINWDVTENNPRVGYFFAREYGRIFLANRENGPSPWRSHVHIRYTPRLALREAWHLAHHLNLNQFQLTFQNKDLVEPDVTNVRDHTDGYLFAMTLMGLPLFFQELQQLSEPAREEIAPLLAAFRAHRDIMHRGYVFPLGDEPDDHSWCGFESHDPTTGSGYWLLFRELHNESRQARIRLPFVAGRVLHATNVMTGEESTVSVDGASHAEFQLEAPGSFVWLRYQPTLPAAEAQHQVSKR